MKALVLKEYMQFRYEDVPEPTIGAEDVLVRVQACGICGSDVHGMDGSTGRRRPPIVMGHEAAGVIHAVGGNAGAWKMGDRVTFDSTVYCGSCWFCRRGDVNLCDRRRVLGVSCDEYRCHGALRSTWPCRTISSTACRTPSPSNRPRWSRCSPSPSTPSAARRSR